MRSLELEEKHSKKLSEIPNSFYKSEFKESLKSFFPGEWILLKDPRKKKIFLGFVNPIVSENYPAINILTHLTEIPKPTIVEDYIAEAIKKSIAYRLKFEGYSDSSRIIYGESDGLPGLVVDLYQNVCLIQINSAGMDKKRDFIKNLISQLVKKDTFIVDGSKQRTQEMLPLYREVLSIEKIILKENGFKYELGIERLQKNGWYFDHRENRKKFELIIKRIDVEKKSGLDLFCYQGAWGFHLLRAGCENVVFVDQADMNDVIKINADANNLKNTSFCRMDVFKWLDDAIVKKDKYNIIVSDPPAFAKKKSEKKSALDGYVKLHKKIMKIANNQSLVCFASCTHYVSESEFIATIELAAKSEKRKIKILDRGMQAWDHPVNSLESKSNYIKSIIVIME